MKHNKTENGGGFFLSSIYLTNSWDKKELVIK